MFNEIGGCVDDAGHQDDDEGEEGGALDEAAAMFTEASDGGETLGTMLGGGGGRTGGALLDRLSLMDGEKAALRFLGFCVGDNTAAAVMEWF